MKLRRGTLRVAESLSGIATPRHVCASCRRSIIHRKYASAATAEAVKPFESNDLTESAIHHPEEPSASVPKPFYRLNAGVVLSRPPVLTRDLHPFESAYFFYQRRLNDRLALPFSRYFYFKKGTPADIEWKRKQRDRITPSRDIGVYNAYGKEGWNDELLVGAKESEVDHQVDALLKDAEAPAISGGPEAGVEVGVEQAASRREEVERPASRVTEADEKGDEKSLNRLLQRVLYLLVKNREGQWIFPSATIEAREGLSRTAERVLLQGTGPNMNTWIVGNTAIGHYNINFKQPREVSEREHAYELGEKTFFVKGRIMAGQADLTNNILGFTDFKWLAKDEIQKLVTERYWSRTQDMLSER